MLSSQIENKMNQITRLESKDQTKQLCTLIDTEKNNISSLKFITQKLISDDIHPQAAKTSLIYLANEAKSFESELFFDISCFVINSIKQHLSIHDEADFILRDSLFTYYIALEEYSEAAKMLSGANLESTNRPFTNKEKVDIFIKCAEAVLEVNETIDAEIYMNKASPFINSVDDWLLQLRFRLTFARVLDANRKFIDASLKYYELSTINNSSISQEDLIELLAKAVTCAILGKAGQQRTRILGLLAKDERLCTLDHIEKYSTHSTVLLKMHLNQIIRKNEIILFESSLTPHQKAIAADGISTILEKAIIEHNMIAVSMIYDNISFQELATILSLPTSNTEKIAAAMITDERLAASIDQTNDMLIFIGHYDSLGLFDEGIRAICNDITSFYDKAQKISQ